MKDLFRSKNKVAEILERKHQKQQLLGKFKMYSLLGCVFLLVFAFVALRVEYWQTATELRQLLRQKRQLEAAVLPLTLEIGFLERLDRIERLAKQNLGLVYPKLNQIDYIFVQMRAPKVVLNDNSIIYHSYP